MAETLPPNAVLVETIEFDGTQFDSPSYQAKTYRWDFPGQSKTVKFKEVIEGVEYARTQVVFNALEYTTIEYYASAGVLTGDVLYTIPILGYTGLFLFAALAAVLIVESWDSEEPMNWTFSADATFIFTDKSPMPYFGTVPDPAFLPKSDYVFLGDNPDNTTFEV